MTDVWKIVVSLAGGAVSAAVLGLIGAWIGRRSEHKKWLREERLDAYRDYLQTLETYASIFRVDAPWDQVTIKSLAEDLMGKAAGVLLLGPEPVADAAMEMRTVIAESYDENKKDDAAESLREARATFTVAARKALNISDF
jgi:hypothetical protein